MGAVTALSAGRRSGRPAARRVTLWRVAVVVLLTAEIAMWTVPSRPATAAPLGTPAPGPAKDPAHVLVIPYTAVSAIMAPLWVAVEKHLFAAYGLEVTTQSVANGAVATAAMLGGSYAMIMNDARPPFPPRPEAPTSSWSPPWPTGSTRLS